MANLTYSQADIDKANRYLANYAKTANPTAAQKATYNQIASTYSKQGISSGKVDVSKATSAVQGLYNKANPTSTISKPVTTPTKSTPTSSVTKPGATTPTKSTPSSSAAPSAGSTATTPVKSPVTPKSQIAGGMLIEQVDVGGQKISIDPNAKSKVGFTQAQLDTYNRYLARYAADKDKTVAENTTYKQIMDAYGSAIVNGKIDASKLSGEQQRAYMRANPTSDYTKEIEMRFVKRTIDSLASGGPLTDAQKAQLDTLSKKWNIDVDKAVADSNFEDVGEFVDDQADNMFEEEKARIEAEKARQIAELEKAYQDAIAAGEVSVREAEQAFEAQKAQIEETAYIQTQQTELAANDRGIQNSQQMVGLMQGDAARKQSNMSGAMSERDSRVADIKDRLKAITAKKDLDIASTNATSQSNINMARANADKFKAGTMADLKIDDYKTNRDMQNTMKQIEANRLAELEKIKIGHANEKEILDINNKNDLAKLAVSQKYALEQMAKAQGYDLEKMNLQQRMDLAKMAQQNGYDVMMADKNQRYTLEQFAVQHGYDLQKMSVSQQNDLAKMATQQGYDIDMAGINQGYTLETIGVQAKNELSAMYEQDKLAQANELKAYDSAVQRELAKYKPGTNEYKIKQSQLADERAKLISDTHTATTYEAYAKRMLGQVTSEPAKPKKDWYETDAQHKDEMAAYEKKMRSYKRYTDFMKDPMTAFPS